jgi:hypothetical protein
MLVNWEPASLWHRNPSRRQPRRHAAIFSASRTISVRMCEATDQPTIIRLKASTMKHT